MFRMSVVNVYHFYGETLKTISSSHSGVHRITLLTPVMLCIMLFLTHALGTVVPYILPMSRSDQSFPWDPHSQCVNRLALCTLVKVEFRMMYTEHRALSPTAQDSMK